MECDESAFSHTVLLLWNHYLIHKEYNTKLSTDLFNVEPLAGGGVHG